MTHHFLGTGYTKKRENTVAQSRSVLRRINRHPSITSKKRGNDIFRISLSRFFFGLFSECVTSPTSDNHAWSWQPRGRHPWQG